MNSIEMYMRQRIDAITYRLRDKLQQRLSASLGSNIDEANTVTIVFSQFSPVCLRFTQLILNFKSCRIQAVDVYVLSFMQNVTATVVVNRRQKLVINRQLSTQHVRFQYYAPKRIWLPNFILKISTHYVSLCLFIGFFYFFRNIIYFIDCFSNCSGHGVCDNFTKHCLCDTYWMPNLFTSLFNGRRDNCGMFTCFMLCDSVVFVSDWSILYFIIITMILFVIIAMLTYYCCYYAAIEDDSAISKSRCTFLNGRKRRRRSRVRYQKVDDNQSPPGRVLIKSNGISMFNCLFMHNVTFIFIRLSICRISTTSNILRFLVQLWQIVTVRVL